MTLNKFKTFVGISLDTSYSITSYGLVQATANDYNNQISSIKKNALDYDQEVSATLSVNGFGNTDLARIEYFDDPIQNVNSIEPRTFRAEGRGTPLYDSVGLLIEEFEKVQDKDASFLIVAITDGQENSSRRWKADKLSKKIKELQATDRWSFVFRVPRGYAGPLVRSLNLFEGNVQEWDQTEAGLKQSSMETVAGMDTYFSNTSQGIKATKTFYASTANLTQEEVKAQLVDISSQVQMWTVQTAAEGSKIREFVEHKLGTKMLKGAAFYKLVAGKKSADKVQASKLIIIRDKKTGVIYQGAAARDMIGLSRYTDTKVRPGDLGDWELFIQSTSVNRVLPAGTELIYWDRVGHHYKQGPSA